MDDMQTLLLMLNKSYDERMAGTNAEKFLLKRFGKLKKQDLLQMTVRWSGILSIAAETLIKIKSDLHFKDDLDSN